jgi:hypothetical protein
MRSTESDLKKVGNIYFKITITSLFWKFNRKIISVTPTADNFYNAVYSLITTIKLGFITPAD